MCVRLRWSSATNQVGSDEPFPSVKLHCLVPTVGEAAQSLGDLLAGVFGKGRGKVVPVPEADVYILVRFPFGKWC
jgi:hypothetical protein